MAITNVSTSNPYYDSIAEHNKIPLPTFAKGTYLKGSAGIVFFVTCVEWDTNLQTWVYHGDVLNGAGKVRFEEEHVELA
ncbi:MAG: hypothetical protein ACOC5T_07775 [Elusimicrobiota bacterium]